MHKRLKYPSEPTTAAPTSHQSPMTSRSRSYGQNSDWDNRNDYNSSTCDEDSSNNGLDLCRLYLTNIPKGLNEEGLKTAFSKFGTLVECHISKDPQKRYGLVKYETQGEAKFALMKMNRTEPLRLIVSFAKHRRTDKPQRDRHDRSNGNIPEARERDSTGPMNRDRDSTGPMNRDRDESASLGSRGKQSR